MSFLVQKQFLVCLLNGFSSGLPLYFLYQMLPAWLRSSEVDLKTIGLFAIVGVPYNWKFLWAPLLDRYALPFWGRRRGWMLLTQVACLLTMMSFASIDPTTHLSAVAALAAILAFFSATQDIVLDAYRRELLKEEELGMGMAYYMNAYRVSSLVPAGLGLIMADQFSWSFSYVVVSAFMLIGILQTLWIDELDLPTPPKHSFYQSLWLPLKDFWQRHQNGGGSAIMFLLFLFFYKLGDNMATALITPFYIDIGFELATIGSVVKITSLVALIVGSIIGGLVIYRLGINKSLWLFGWVQMLTIFGFAWLSLAGPKLWVLIVVVAGEYLGVALGAAALGAFTARATSIEFSGTQLALFSSFFTIPRTFANAITGFIVEGIQPTDTTYYKIFGAMPGLGWTQFFVLCGFLALPGMLLLLKVAPWQTPLPTEK